MCSLPGVALQRLTPGVEEPDEPEETQKKPGSSKPSRNGGPKSKKKVAIVCDSDFEPDDLQPEFMKAQTMLFELERPFQDLKKGGKKKGKQSRTPGATED